MRSRKYQFLQLIEDKIERKKCHGWKTSDRGQGHMMSRRQYTLQETEKQWKMLWQTCYGTLKEEFF